MYHFIQHHPKLDSDIDTRYSSREFQFNVHWWRRLKYWNLLMLFVLSM